jgi:hypothetical protein
MEEIRNKVKESGLVQLDLADFKPKNEIVGIDIASQLWQGLILKEKDFREWIKLEDWSKFTDKCVYIHCSADAIVPTWAFMLVASSLNGIAKKAIFGNRLDLEKQIIQENIEQINLEELKEKRVIVKGCSDIPSPEYAMITLLNHIQPHILSLMYGEPCSTVPIYKRPK